MMAAVAAARAGSSVCLIEKNEKLGKKLFITGKGRCNVTNAGDMDTLFANVCTNPKFLYSAFYGFDNTAVMKFLEHAGCKLKTERGDRVFPVSDHSSDVIGALQRELKKCGVEVLLNTKAADILKASQEMTFMGVRLSDGRVIHGDRGIICTGGMSYPATGSTGDGYRFARAAGHKVSELKPALVPLLVEEAWCRQLMGLSLRNVALRLLCGGRKVYEGFG